MNEEMFLGGGNRSSKRWPTRQGGVANTQPCTHVDLQRRMATLCLRRLGHLLLATLAISAYAKEMPCTLHHGDNYYDLNPLKARCAAIFTLHA